MLHAKLEIKNDEPPPPAHLRQYRRRWRHCPRRQSSEPQPAGSVALAAIIAGTDLLVTVPERLGDVIQRAARVKLLPAPIELPTYLVKQHWHERYHHDAANRWLRGVVAELFLA